MNKTIESFELTKYYLQATTYNNGLEVRHEYNGDNHRELAKWFINLGHQPTLKEVDDKFKSLQDKDNGNGNGKEKPCHSNFWSKD